MSDPHEPTLSAATRDLLGRLFEALDYDALGPVYCDEGGDAFWAAHRGPAQSVGGTWAEALLRRVPRGGRSLYVGAGVAELPVLLAEVLDADRAVEVTNLLAEECDVLNAALASVGLGDRIRYRCADAGESGGTFDHLSVVSVLNDPGTFPTVSGVAYGRIPPVLLEVEEFVAERDRVRALVTRLLAGLVAPGLVTTTFEEVPWFLAGAQEAGRSVEADEEVIETAIVGDPLGFLRVG